MLNLEQLKEKSKLEFDQKVNDLMLKVKQEALDNLQKLLEAQKEEIHQLQKNAEEYTLRLSQLSN
jgi:uncharacterized phage infection (PIP) family protein YhgE